MRRFLLITALSAVMFLGALTPTMAASSYDSDCNKLVVHVQTTSRSDSHYSFHALAQRDSIWWSRPYGIDVQDVSGTWGGYTFSA